MNDRRKGDRRVPPALAQFALDKLTETGEQAAIDLTVQNVEILRARVAELETNEKIWQALVSLDELGGLVNEAMDTELAALKAKPSAGVADERAEFAAWVRREWPQAPLSLIRDLLPPNDPRYGEYCDESLQRAWVGWQARARLKASAVAVPDGYVMVPVEPTIEMVEAGHEVSFGQPDRSKYACVIEQYDAMIAAATSAQKGKPAKKGCTKPGCFPYCDCGSIDDAQQGNAVGDE